MFSILISVGWLYSEAKNRRAKVRMRPVPLAKPPAIDAVGVLISCRILYHLASRH